MTILDTLRGIQQKQDIRSFYRYLCNDPSVQCLKDIPTEEQVRQYFRLFQEGVEYAARTYGSEVLASNLRFFYHLFEQETEETLVQAIGYDPSTDTILMTTSLIAQVSAWFRSGSPGGVFPNDHLPTKRAVRAEDLTVLYALEESYHRYQRHVKHYPVISTGRGNRGHFMEKEIEGIWQKALGDLQMVLYSLSDEWLRGHEPILTHVSPNTTCWICRIDKTLQFLQETSPHTDTYHLTCF